MKRKFCALLIAVASLSLVGCNNQNTSVVSSANQSSQASSVASSAASSVVSSVAVSSASSSLVSSENHSVDIDVGQAPTFQEDALYIHYWRADGTYKNWDLWLWDNSKSGAAYAFNGKDDWGVIMAIPLSTFAKLDSDNQLGLIVRKGGDTWAEKDLNGSDTYVDLSKFKKDENGIYHLYLISGEPSVYYNKERGVIGAIRMATFVSETSISLKATIGITKYVLKKDGVDLLSKDINKTKSTSITLPAPLDYMAGYTIEATLENGDTLTSSVTKTLLFNSKSFNDTYNYDGDDLGVTYTSSKSTFKVWSPLSSKIVLRIYESGTPKSVDASKGDDTFTSYDMTKGEKGVFSAEVPGDLDGKYYTYVVTNGEYKEKETIDPYAKACGVNGIRGMIVDFDKTNPENWDLTAPSPYDRKGLTVYETHVADVTSSKTWLGTQGNRKLFSGMHEKGTTYTEGGVTVKTGFDHIKELGVNAVQILPFFDQANDEINPTFNWGYNPSNYNCLEGSYSSNPYDGYVRIREMKSLIKDFTDNGMNIIMDVVYNHTNGAIGSNFDIIMPGYYYRYTGTLELSNGSGCGNETASDHYMFRKFMIDSAKFWAKEYKLGGFRFDLMGLHDIETMNQLTAAVKEINPNIVIYGEPWAGGTSTLGGSYATGVPANQQNGGKYVGYGAFNDKIRDSLIKGGLSAATELGWITTKDPIAGSDQGALIKGVRGVANATPIDDPDKVVTYVTCHDNYTLYDRAIATKEYTSEDDAILAKMNVLANSVVFTSQGTSFMLAGEEFLRTKQGNSNSYNASYEVNELDYSLKIKHQDMFKSYQKMIALKQNLDGLHLDKEGIKNFNPVLSSDTSTLSYSLKDNSGNREFKVFHVNGLGTNQKVDLSGYNLYYSTIDGESKILSDATELKPYETLVAYKSL